MKYLVLIPEALVGATAVIVLMAGRLSWSSPAARRSLPAVVALVTLVALGIELWAGATLGSYFEGGLVQDRFALFAKAAVLLAAAIAFAVVDWTAEDSLTISLAMPLIATFGVMVAASAGDLVALWAGLELAAAAGVVMVALRRPDLALRLLVTGGVASAMLLTGLAFLYASAGTSSLATMRAVLFSGAPTLALAIPVFLVISGLAVRAALGPFQLASIPASVGASPLGAGLVLGLVAAAAATVAIKLVAALTPIPSVYSTYLEVIAALAMVGGGVAALAAQSPRARLAYLAAGQIGWVAAGLATHYRSGLAGSLFLLGAFAVAATCGPAVMGGAEGGEQALAGMGAQRPARYIQSPPDEARRTTKLPVLSGLSSFGAVAFCVVIAAYGILSSPILGLADQGAEALGLR